MTNAFLALGSNLGERIDILRGARRALEGMAGVSVTAVSPLYETLPVGGPPGQGPDLNAVLQVATTLTARDLLAQVLTTEQSFGRDRGERWGARTLDIDILFFGEAVYQESALVIPHPRLHLRGFVLAPLLHIAPDLVHPVLGRTIRQLFADLPAEGGILPLAEHW
jgi:2-amino-4-hydroxy-6-hydroxymethyldihydropteridine diphosphokinase